MVAREVKVYSTPTCPWCHKVKKFLDEHKVTYRDLNVAEDHDARDEMIKVSSQTAVPTIVIDGEVIVGFNESAIRTKLGI